MQNDGYKTKEEVRKCLGKPGRYFTDPDFMKKDAFYGDTWMYSSLREVPYGHYLLIEFGKDGKVQPQGIGWASE
jgi:hypothetical protein